MTGDGALDWSTDMCVTNNGGTVLLYSGLGLSPVYTFTPPYQNDPTDGDFGYSISSGDLNDDGDIDIIIGDPFGNSGVNPHDRPNVTVFENKNPGWEGHYIPSPEES